jgi:hypothetical protein
MAKEGILREIFSGANGRLSSKRIIGGVAMAVALGCTIYLVVVDRSNEVVENLLMTVLIMAASLLGLPAITGAWGRSKMSIGAPDAESDEPSNNIKHKPIDPCESCPHNKKGA